MADDADRAGDIADRLLERQIAGAVRVVPAGEPGDCRTCDSWSPRLVGGRCAPCRDGRRR
ncbi:MULTISPECIES: hypothetical protein [Sphingomonas]|jgi:hypothetical protein|uniref:Conjugal transfer protein TraR n=1 Tax=Sphingomonas melonis TY TaxID=621456 RepID=A0A175Y4F1_9SPHN|nr:MULTISPECIES: hypothetical protein [Sphingomonas]AOW22754.1 conjugal transfer protein TraR [Sphingomonas melonis TY]ATI56159.1 conjugal transfer protein TraR [Sphingomonas melonis]KZB95315.1 conjugal transfer protein TraR [Sphingomonas melonis TY]MBI0530792.1 conjugal transfer protein TraR [Sphingomonas sp. TX0522]MBX8845123.1 conjugal transfer protein TraR [Sphingomonas melonis]